MSAARKSAARRRWVTAGTAGLRNKLEYSPLRKLSEKGLLQRPSSFAQEGTRRQDGTVDLEYPAADRSKPTSGRITSQSSDSPSQPAAHSATAGSSNSPRGRGCRPIRVPLLPG